MNLAPLTVISDNASSGNGNLSSQYSMRFRDCGKGTTPVTKR